jgi:hypothetical protein
LWIDVMAWVEVVVECCVEDQQKFKVGAKTREFRACAEDLPRF